MSDECIHSDASKYRHNRLALKFLALSKTFSRLDVVVNIYDIANIFDNYFLSISLNSPVLVPSAADRAKSTYSRFSMAPLYEHLSSTLDDPKNDGLQLIHEWEKKLVEIYFLYLSYFQFLLVFSYSLFYFPSGCSRQRWLWCYAQKCNNYAPRISRTLYIFR